MRVTRRERAAWASVAVVVVVLMSAPPSARADEKAACIAASEDAQQRRLDGKLTEARRLLLYCARAECPAIVKQDCAQWITEVDAALPTVVLKAQGSYGQDLFSVRVLEDGVVVAERLDGRPLAVDPGRHVFRFVPDGGFPPVELEVLASAGDKYRPILAHMAQPTPVRMASPPTTEPSTSKGPSPLAWVFGGVAVAALGTALGFEIAQVHDYDHLSSTCAGHCAPSDVDHVGTERWIAGVSAGVGVLGLGASAYFLFLAPRAKDPKVALDVRPLHAGGFATLSARF
jgi:hypothetical protein